MRAVGLIGLVIALAIGGWLAKDALRAVAPMQTPAAGAAEGTPAPRRAVQAYGQNLKHAMDAAAAARASEASK